MSFLKSIFAVSLTGASSVGGTLIYQSAVPGSWKDVLIKEGYYFLNSDNDYKAIYEDQKGDIVTKVEEFKSITSSDAHAKIKSWCETELPKPYSWDNQKRKELVNLCTSDGIITVKARLISIGKSSFIIDESDTTKQDKQYKIIFAIYRYLDRFINWIQRTIEGTQDYNSSTAVDTGYLKLKTACETELKRHHKGNNEVRYYKHISWWCQKVEYEDFEGLAKKRKENWQTDEEGTGKGTIWQHTDAVTNHIITSSDNGENQTQKTLDDKKVKEWCTQNKNTSLHENNNYQSKFIVFLSVCQKTSD